MPENITKREIEVLTEKVGEKLLAVASTDTKDRMGDIVEVGGWDLKNFKKNPILLFAHKYDEPPIGYAKNIKIENNRLVFEPIFHEITQLAREIKAMFMADPPIMRAFSVGFIPLQFDEEDRHIITKQELLEISAVPVPANAEALTLASKSYSPDDEKEIVKWLDKVKKECPKCDKDLEEIIDIKPYPNEHSCRLQSPDKYDRFARKNCAAEHEDKCIDFIFGIKEDKSELQAMRYKKDIWTVDDAKSHCQSKDGSFEPASEKQIEEKEEIKKEGRILSIKTLEAIDDAITSMKNAVSVLKELRQLANKPSDDGEDESLQGRREEAHKSRKNRVIVRALQKMSKELNKTLRNVKEEK